MYKKYCTDASSCLVKLEVFNFIFRMKNTDRYLLNGTLCTVVPDVPLSTFYTVIVRDPSLRQLRFFQSRYNKFVVLDNWAVFRKAFKTWPQHTRPAFDREPMSGLLASICCPNCGGASHTVSTNQPMSAAFPPIKQVELSASKISYLIFTPTSSAVLFATSYQTQSCLNVTVNVYVNRKSSGFPFWRTVTDYCHLVVRSDISSYTGTVGWQLKSFSFRIHDADNFELWVYKHRTLF